MGGDLQVPVPEIGATTTPWTWCLVMVEWRTCLYLDFFFFSFLHMWFLFGFAFSDRILHVVEGDLEHLMPLLSLSQGWYYTLVLPYKPYFKSYFELDSSILLPQPPGSKGDRLTPLRPAPCLRLSALPKPCFRESVNSEGIERSEALAEDTGR